MPSQRLDYVQGRNRRRRAQALRFDPLPSAANLDRCPIRLESDEAAWRLAFGMVAAGDVALEAEHLKPAAMQNAGDDGVETGIEVGKLLIEVR